MDHSFSLEQARKQLLDVRRAMTTSICQYPTPISGCDAQFNHLLAERAKVDAALRALDRDVFVPTPRQLNPEDKIEMR